MADDPNLSGAAQPDQDATSEESAEELRAKAIKFVFLSALEQFADNANVPGLECTVMHYQETNEPAGIRIRGTLLDDFGAYSFEYLPLAAIKKMISLIAQDVADMTMTFHSSEGSKVIRLMDNGMTPEFAADAIVKTAERAAYYLLLGLSVNLAGAVKASFNQSHEIALAALQSNISQHLQERAAIYNVNLDATSEIERHSREAAARERELWARLYGAIPGVRSRRIKGRPKEWTTAKLKSAVKKAAKAARPTLKPGEHLTLEHVTIELNKNRSDQKPLTVDALKKLLKRYEVDWMTIKSDIIIKGYSHFSKNK
jgi:hypothetical protein